LLPPCGLLLIKLQTYKFLGHTQVRAIRFTTKGFTPLPATYAPSPPSLKAQAQSELDRLIALIPSEGALAMAEPIRRALETLPE
jgi:hypothetical protein